MSARERGENKIWEGKTVSTLETVPGRQNTLLRTLLLFIRFKMRVTAELDRRIRCIKRLSRACTSKIWTVARHETRVQRKQTAGGARQEKSWRHDATRKSLGKRS